MGYYLLDNPSPGYPQYANPRRGGAKPSGTIIVHTAENAMDLSGPDDSAENVANFIRFRSDYGSYHRLVDADSIIKMVPFDYEAWQDSETNNWGIGISAAVQAARWLDIPNDRRNRIYRNLAKAAAAAVRYMKDEHGVTVPLRRISGADARARKPGFAAHGDSGISRSDPGKDFGWGYFFKLVAEELGQSAPTVKPAATPKTKSISQLADEVIDGKYGSGDARKKALGSKYAAVQAEVNRRLLGTAAPKPKAKSISQLASEVIDGKHGTGDARKRALGAQYAAVQAEVNRRLLGSAPRGKSIAQLADEVIAGKHGNGAQRQKSLGSRYAAVQAEVNRRYS